MSRFLRTTVVTLVLLLTLGAGAVPALAASPSASNLTANPQFMRAGVDVPIFGIDLIAATLSTNLSEVRVDFAQVTGGGTFDIDDLEANPDGIKLWRDSSMLGANQDRLDGGDARVPSTFTFSGMRATLAISPAYPLPATEEGSYTFFLTIQLSSAVTNGDDFTATLPQDAFFTGALFSPSITPVTTNRIVADTIAPTASFTGALTQGGNVFWIISEPVIGVVSDSAVLRLAGTSDNLPATVSYNDATKTITLDPAITLISGLPYDAILLPNGPGSITDRAGNELASKTNTFRGALHVEESAFGATYNWRRYSTSSAYGGSYLVNNYVGGAATFTFTGTSVTWYTITDPYQGKATVYIDGVSKGTINNYASTTRYKVARAYTGLSNAKHTIALRVTGLKGSTSGRDARVSIDAFKVGGTLHTTPAVTMRWATVSSSSASGGTYSASRFPWSDMTFVFYGTGVEWKTIVGPTMGRAVVYIDGVSRGVVDNYGGTTIFKFIRRYTGLSQGLHTIRIQVYGTRNANAKDSIIAVDGFTAL